MAIVFAELTLKLQRGQEGNPTEAINKWLAWFESEQSARVDAFACVFPGSVRNGYIGQTPDQLQLSLGGAVFISTTR